MKSKKAIGAMWILALLPVILMLVCLPGLPERVPTHWNLDGTVTYSSRAALWILAGISPAVAALFQFLPRLDPKRRNYEKFQGWYDGMGVLLALFLLLCMVITLSESLHPGRISVSRAIGLAIGVLFLVIGNMMGKVKSNWFMGFRTPWALSDPDVWNKTQRMGGRVFFIAGLSCFPLSLLAPEKVFLGIFLLILFGGVALTYVMSWKWYREKRAS